MAASGFLALHLVGAAAPSARRIEYADLPEALHRRLGAAAADAAAFRGYLGAVEAETDRRVSEGEREHLIYYALQSTRFTRRPRIEPALSSRRFVERLSPSDRDRLLEDASYLPAAGWPDAERERLADLLRSLRTPSADERLSYFRQLLRGAGDTPSVDALYPDYVRVARFLYRKEFIAGGGSPSDVAAVAELYHTRPLSSDTEIEAGFGVSVGLATLRVLDPALRVARVLVVGPGLDFAPRTDLVDAVPPQSYQPFAVADALLTHSLASERDLHVHAVDVNPRVVGALQAFAQGRVTLHLFTGIAESAERPFSTEFRAYLRSLGRAIGDAAPRPPGVRSDVRYQHSIAVRESISRAMSAARLNVMTERPIDQPPFDLAVVTNVFAYFDDRQLALALSNIAALLRPGGYLLHNEVRPALGDMAASLDMPAVHMRTLLLRGPAARPLYDVIYLHQRQP